MKRSFLFLVLSFGLIIDAIAQSDAIYVYKKDGTIQSFLKEDFNNVSYSHYDANNVYHEDFVSQEIETKAGVSRILLEEIDSVRLVAPQIENSINPAYVPIDWNNVSLKDCDRENFIFHLQCNGEAPDVKPSSVITINEDNIMHIILVTKVEKNGNEMIITGCPGDLGNLFFNTEFTFMTQDADIAQKAIGISINKNNNYFEIGEKFDWNFSGKIDFIKEGSTKDKASYIDYNTNLYLALNLKFCFGDRVETVMDGISFLRAGYYYIDASFTGGAKWVCDYTGEFNSENAHIDLAHNQEDKYELLPIKIPEKWVTIPIASIPIPIAIGGDFYKQATLNVKNTHGKATAGFDAIGEGTIGFRYNGITGKSSGWYEDWHFTPNRHNPTVEGYIETEAKFYVFPRIHAWIGGTAGPSIDLKPYLRTNVSGGFHADIVETQKDDYLAWSLTNAAGVDWSLGWSTSAWGAYEGSNKELFNGTFTENDWLLYRSPNSIKFLSSSSDAIKKDNPLDVKFEVCDTSFLAELPTCLPQVVKFECNSGTVEGNDSCYSFAKNGLVTAKWTPGSSTDVLYARLYDKEGNIMAEDFWGDNICPDDNHPHMIDLGLPSGTKWSCCNIGATSPDLSGGYYSWGETFTKSKYESNTYSYFIRYQDSKYGDWPVPIYVHIGTNISGTSYDVAHVKWGNGWRMPTMQDIKELKSSCTSKQYTYNGVKGRLYTGSNGNCIFLPAVGGYSSSWYSSGYYWSSTLCPHETNCEDSKYGWNPYVLDVDDNTNIEHYIARHCGLPIRPVICNVDLPEKVKQNTSTETQTEKDEGIVLEPTVVKDNVIVVYERKKYRQTDR